jgi:hypothetical protein
MPEEHQFGEQYLSHLASTQQAYAERRLNDYLDGFAEQYFSVQLYTSWAEDKVSLATKIERDFDRFELLQMDFTVLRSWFSGDLGYAHLSYETRLRVRETGRILLDKRENLLIGTHLGSGRWLIDCKIVLSAENHYEDGAAEL